MPGTDASTAFSITEKLHHELLHTDFHLKSGIQLAVSASVGIATAPADATARHAIIGSADARMYAVKNSGRGQIRGA
jgi:diguanylate cyclase (GGDEF)-like protein